MSQPVIQESLMVPVSGRVQLHLRRIWTGEKGAGQPVLMLHGAAEDGLIFYSHGGRGLACYLARHGYQVFVADMRGKGKSWPAINQNSDFGFHELVSEDIPALAAMVRRVSGGLEQTWVTHSMGGPLAAASLVRSGPDALGVRQMVHFAARRRVAATGIKRRLLVDLLWNRVGRIAVAFQGYLPSEKLGLGTARESSRCFHDGINWSTREQWIDSEDGFDYGVAAKKMPWIRSLYFASARDSAFANPDDVRDFMHELGRHDGRMMVLGRSGGNLQDYSHTGMLLHADAESDHFPQLLAWLREGERAG
jgi:predicted alpha/beta hydrolase